MSSIVIPVYNRIEALKRALASIAAQTYKDVEVIIVDDGSAERLKIEDLRLSRRKVRDPALSSGKISVPVKLIRQENKGAPAARNRGLAEAKGEYVIFWDGDVIGEPQMLEKLKKALDENLEASYAYCSHRSYVIGHMTKKLPACDFNITKLRENNYIHSTTLIRRRDAIQWDESIKRFQDWDLWLMMSEIGKTGVWVNEYLFTVLGGGTISKWLPRIAYKAPFKWLPFVNKSVSQYEEARKIILQKHKINPSLRGSAVEALTKQSKSSDNEIASSLRS